MSATRKIGRFTFNAWRDRGFKLQAGRVLYHSAWKLWARIGPIIFSVEVANKAKP